MAITLLNMQRASHDANTNTSTPVEGKVASWPPAHDTQSTLAASRPHLLPGWSTQGEVAQAVPPQLQLLFLECDSHYGEGGGVPACGRTLL